MPRSVLLNSEYTPVDLSESGMQLCCDSEIRIGRILDLSLSIGGRNISINGVVIWCNKSSSIYDNDYRVGIEFSGHSISDQLLIREYIENN